MAHAEPRGLSSVAVCRVSNIVLTEAEKLRDGWQIIAAGRQIGTKQSSQRQLQVNFSAVWCTGCPPERSLSVIVQVIPGRNSAN